MVIPLFADVTHEVTFGGSDRIIEDYINNTYNMSITITFTGTELNTYGDGGECTLQIAYAIEGDTPDSFNDCTGSLGAPKAITNGFTTWNLDAAAIFTQLASNPGGSNFDGYLIDFNILYQKAAQADGNEEIEAWGTAGGNDSFALFIT